MPCPRCGETNPLRLGHLEAPPPSLADQPAIYMRSTRCGATSNEALRHLVYQLPEVQAFWRRHPRMHLHPYERIERDGMDTWLTTFESVADGARLTVAANAETLEPSALDR